MAFGPNNVVVVVDVEQHSTTTRDRSGSNQQQQIRHESSASDTSLRGDPHTLKAANADETVS